MHGKFFERDGEGDLGVDARKRMGELRALLSRFQTLAGAGRDLIEMGIDALERAVLLQQGEGCLGADAGDAGDVVGRVAHERFLFDDLFGGEADLFIEVLRRQPLHVGDAALGEADADIFIDELIGIAVARIDERLYIAVGAGQRADDVVGFISLLFHHADAHRREQLFENGELYDEIFGHGGARPLVVGIHLVTEGGGVQVESHPEIGGAFVLEDLKEELDEPVNAVGGETVLGGEVTDRIVCAVHEGIAVDENESLFIHILIVSRGEKFCKKNPEIA